jgi:hypothetical protein
MFEINIGMIDHVFPRMCFVVTTVAQVANPTKYNLAIVYALWLDDW